MLLLLCSRMDSSQTKSSLYMVLINSDPLHVMDKTGFFAQIILVQALIFSVLCVIMNYHLLILDTTLPRWSGTFLIFLFFALQHGSQCTLGKHVASQPTYVYPESLKAVVREIVPGNLMDQEDPTGPMVI